MGKDDKTHRDIWWGPDGIRRLERLAIACKASQGEVARQALMEYEVSRSLFRDSVRDAVLALFRAMLPDEQYDPSDDPRPEEAVVSLGELLNSPYAAEGIQQAFMMLLAQNVEAIPTLSIPLLDDEHDQEQRQERES